MGIVLRLVSLILVVIALMVLGGDVLVLFETSTYDPRSFIGLWGALHAASAEAAKAWVAGLPDVAAGVVNAIFGAPAFVVLGLPGVLIGLFAYGRR